MAQPRSKDGYPKQDKALITARQQWRKEHEAKKKAERAASRAGKQRAVQEEMCRRVSTGVSLRTVCQEDRTMPSYNTVLLWLRDQPEFAAAYRDAQRFRADALFEEALVIADTASNDWMARNDPNNPGYQLNGEAIARSKLRVDTRKWAASKLNPARYGDKLAVEGNDDKPVVVSVVHKVVQITRQETVAPVDPIEVEWHEPVAHRPVRVHSRKSDWDEE